MNGRNSSPHRHGRSEYPGTSSIPRNPTPRPSLSTSSSRGGEPSTVQRPQAPSAVASGNGGSRRPQRDFQSAEEVQKSVERRQQTQQYLEIKEKKELELARTLSSNAGSALDHCYKEEVKNGEKRAEDLALAELEIKELKEKSLAQQQLSTLREETDKKLLEAAELEKAIAVKKADALKKELKEMEKAEAEAEEQAKEREEMAKEQKEGEAATKKTVTTTKEAIELELKAAELRKEVARLEVEASEKKLEKLRKAKEQAAQDLAASSSQDQAPPAKKRRGRPRKD